MPIWLVPGIVFVTTDDTVPAGKYTAQILKAAGITVNPKSKELDVKAAVTKVVTGEADATVAYATDVLAVGAKAQGVPDPRRVKRASPATRSPSSRPPRTRSAAAAFFARRGQRRRAADPPQAWFRGALLKRRATALPIVLATVAVAFFAVPFARAGRARTMVEGVGRS